VDEAHFTNLAVRADQRRTGLGKALLQAMLKKAREQGCVADLECAPSNQGPSPIFSSRRFCRRRLRPATIATMTKTPF